MTRTRVCLLASCCAVLSCSGSVGVTTDEPRPESITQATVLLTPGTFTSSMNLAPGMGAAPGNIALLTNGTVLASGSQSSKSWYELTTRSSGFNGYANGTWTQVASATLGRLYNPSFIGRDGRYWEAGGEYTTVGTVQGKTQRNQAEIFDPLSNTWSPLSDDHIGMADAPATLLADGNTILAGPAKYDASVWLFDIRANTWTQSYPALPGGLSSEGGSLLLPDGRVFTGSHSFSIYQPSDESSGHTPWVPTADTTPALDAFSQRGELGPILLLQNGNVLVLGGNGHNGVYAPATDSWLTGRDGNVGRVADTPAGLNSADTAAVVEPNGRVLAVGTTDINGTGAGTLYEYSPDDDLWISVPDQPSFRAGGAIRMLALPVPGDSGGMGEIMVTGTGGKAWFYTPSSDTPPSGSWRASVSSAWVAFGKFQISGTQLNGLTTGADIGDDGKMATNYPVAWVDNVADPGHAAFFARSFDFDQMAPRPSTRGTFGFDMPLFSPGLGQSNGTWNVHVAANGLEASNTVTLTVTNDRGWGFVPQLLF